MGNTSSGQPPKATPKDFFLHLITFILLYVSVVSFIVLLFQYINLAFPNPLAGAYELIATRSAIRWAVSALVVVFPLFMWLSWFLNKQYGKNPEKRKLKPRRWLIYLTLFVAALVIIGDLGTLVYNLLGGDYAGAFILRVLTVLFTAGLVFWYYLWDVRVHGDDQ
jgi:hypothetical protein